MSRPDRDDPLTTPVLFLIFNRPDTTERVFARIREARPTRLYVAADGPRPDHADDRDRCRAARAIVERVDWKCEVRTRFRDSNLGLKRAVVSAIDWLFEDERAGIILEDDCLPNRSFFWFCSEMLERYREDERIMQICGNNFLLGTKLIKDSYYFSQISDIWGWATWKRAWQWFDPMMESFPEFKATSRLTDYMSDPGICNWLMSYFDEAYRSAGRREGIWSSQWVYAMCTQNGLAIVPSANLVAYIGIGDAATHSTEVFREYAGIACEEMDELRHPRFLLPDGEADRVRFALIRRTDPRLTSRHSLVRAWVGRHVPKRYRDAVKRFVPGFGSAE